VECWAKKLHTKRHEALKRGAKLPDQYAKPFNVVQFFERRLDEPRTWRKPQVVAVCFQADVFDPQTRPEWFERAWRVMAETPQHTYLILTKQAIAMKQAFSQMGRVLPNVWPGVTARTQAEADRNIPLLLQTPAAHRWVSLEPLLEAVDLEAHLGGYVCDGCGKPVEREGEIHENLSDPDDRFPDLCGYGKEVDGLDLAIVGGESGHGAPPCDVAWIRSIVRQCEAAGCGCYVKQLGANAVDTAQCDVNCNGTVHYTRPNGDPLLGEARRTPGYTVTWHRMNRLLTSRSGSDPAEWPADLARCRTLPWRG
jgi:protein gp37